MMRSPDLQEAVAFNPSNLDMLVSLGSAHMGRWQAHHRNEDENNIRLRIRQCLVIKPDCEEALNLLARLSETIKWRNRILTAIGVGLGGVFVGMSAVVLLGDGLSLPFQGPSKLDLLEQAFNEEVRSLQRQQEALAAEMTAIQQQNGQQNQRNLSFLQGRIKQLETRVKNLEKQIVQIEIEKPSKLTPRPSTSRSVPPLRGLD
jgi:hypothetical protein